MAGQPKRGIDYAGWDTHMFDDDLRIDTLIDAQGWVGFSIYFFLCQKAFATDGYYYKWSYANAPTTARKMGGGIRSETIIEVVRLCLRIGLFDKGLFDRESIITSSFIQTRYMLSIEKRSAESRKVEPRYWLLTAENTKAWIVVPKISHSLPENAHSLPENATKESKVKESKVKESNNKPASGLSGIIEGYTQNDDLRAALGEFVKMRKTLRKPLTENALNLQLKELNKLGGNDSVKLAVVNQSVMNSWQGFYPLKKEATHKAQRQEENKNASYNLNDWNKMIQSQQSDDFDYSQMFKGGG